MSDFDYTDDDAPDAPPKQQKKKKTAKKITEATGDWRQNLRYNAAGNLTKDPGNAALLLAFDQYWQGCIGYNEFTHKIHWVRPAPVMDFGLKQPEGTLEEEHTVYVQHWLAKWYNVSFAEGSVWSAIRSAAKHNRFHPVRDYLTDLRWDATQRLPSWLHDYLGVEQTEYAARVGTCWLIAAVARIFRPGCKVDNMLVLEGEQSAKKSSSLAALFGRENFLDSKIYLGSDEAYKKLQGKWCVEIAELDAFRGRAASEIKMFLTSEVDTFRPSYGRTDQDFPRTCVFAGTTNEREYLIDRTGNRRFWPVRVGEKIDKDRLLEDRDLLWAEAVARFQSGERWWLDDERLARTAQRAREVREPWFELVAEWLDRPKMPNSAMTLDASEGFTQAEIFQYGLGLRPNDMNRENQTRLGFVMSKLGWERRKISTVEGGVTARKYKYFRRPTREF